MKKLNLISVDKSGIIYLGELEGEKINKVFYGSLTERTDTWKSTELKSYVNKKDIFVAQDGKIYINDNLKGTITELMSDKNTKYSGQFIQLFDNGVISKIDNKIVITSFTQ